MDCPWRRTLASVFLLLSTRNVHVLGQNVVPNGPLPPLPLLREPLRDSAGPNIGVLPQQMNLLPGPPNGILPELVPLIPYPPDYQRIPEYTGPVYPQNLPISPVSQANIGTLPQGPIFNLPPPFLQGPIYNYPINNLPPPQGLPLNIPQTTLVPIPLSQPVNIPQTPLVPVPLGPPANIPQTPLVPIPLPFNNPAPANILPLQGSLPNILPVPLVPLPQGADCVPSIANVALPQNIPPYISQVPVVPSPQGQILPNNQVPFAPITGQVYVPPQPWLQNQNMQVFPLPNSYPLQFLPPYNAPCTLTTDLTSVHFIPPPSIPSSIPIQNFSPQVPVPLSRSQPVMFQQSTVPIDVLSNVPAVPNFQITDLPPVFPTNIAQMYDNPCSQTVVEEYNPVPINLHVNVPSPTIPEPKIIVITTYPTPPAAITDAGASVSNTDSSDVSFGTFPSYPLPPIIIESNRSRSRSWLPLFLIALFARDGYGDGGFGSGCCCCYSCDSGCSNIPVPYPIPIPTNNPVIVENSCRSRKNGKNVKNPEKKD